MYQYLLFPPFDDAHGVIPVQLFDVGTIDYLPVEDNGNSAMGTGKSRHVCW